MERRNHFMLMLFLGTIAIILASCGGASEEKVTKKINNTLQNVTGYKIKAEMVMKTGAEERTYDVNIWYKKGEQDFYRVGLENEAEEESSQVILKNEEGVFVLTPALNKSFKFQTDWPENSSQPYLYHSLVNDIIMDKELMFTASDTHYVFETKTNYQHQSNLPLQEIYFDKKKLTPSHVKIMDKNRHALIEVSFKDVQLSPSFATDDFNRDSILEETLADLSVANMQTEMEKEQAVKYPLETMGAELVEQETIELDDGKRVIMTFKGDRNFTLVQETKSAVEAMRHTVQERTGELVNIGHSLGAITNDAIEWNDEGTEFYLASEELTMEELIEVAGSIQGRGIK